MLAGDKLGQTPALVNLFGELCFRSQFNKRELFVNTRCKSKKAHFDRTHFSAKID